MGAALSSTIKSIDTSSDSGKQACDALNSLLALGESRNDAIVVKATSEAMKASIPIQKILLQGQQIIASASSDQQGIVKGIKAAVGNLLQGQILDGVTSILQNELSIVLGGSAGQLSDNYSYAIIATGLGALLRLDVDVYSFALRSNGLQAYANNMTAVTWIISTIDPQHITLSDVRDIVSSSYSNSSTELQKEIFQLLRQALEMDQMTAAGQPLTDEMHAKYQSLFKPSEYEQPARAT